MMNFKRRDLLKASAAIAAASAAGGFSCIEIANATPVSPQVVDRLSVRVLVDGANNLFLRPGEANGAKIEPPPRAPDYRRTLHTSGACRSTSYRAPETRSARSWSISDIRRRP